MNQEEIRKSETANKIKVISEYIPNYHTVAIGLWGDFGSRDERDDLVGITHLIEHLFFKGTDNRSSSDIVRDIEKYGGMINAFTGRENICLVARVMSSHLENAIDVLTDILKNSRFEQNSIVMEKQVISNEIQSMDEDPMSKVQDMLIENLFKDDNLGRLISGTIDTVIQIEREHLLGYLSGKLTPENLFVVVSGDVDHQELLSLIDDKLGGKFEYSGKLRKLENKYKPLKNIEEKDIELTHLALGTETKGLQNGGNERYILSCLSTVIGGNMSSRLFQRIRDEMGLAYHLGAFNKLYSDKGFFNISFSIPPEVVSKVLEIVDEILREPITGDELHRAREFIKGTIALSLESLSSRMMRKARQFLYFERDIPVEETIENIDRLELEEVNDKFKELVSGDFEYAIISKDVKRIEEEVKKYV